MDVETQDRSVGFGNDDMLIMGLVFCFLRGHRY